jgi:CelD/BcsL family acetyltransferase involved in cellulose biosynthesis
MAPLPNAVHMLAASMELEVRIEHSFEPLAEGWDELADRLGAPPQLRPGWFATWFRAFGAGRPELLAARREGRVNGVLPLDRHRGVLRGLANYHSPGFGALTEDSETLRVLCERALDDSPRRLELPLIDANGQLAGAALETARIRRSRVLARTTQRTPVVSVDGGDWDSYLHGLSRSFRKELRRYRRRLDEFGAVRFEITDGSEGLADRLREVFAVEGMGWKAEGGTAILSRPDTHRFYSEVAGWASARGALRLLILRVDERPVAVDLALEERGSRYMLKGGFDPAYSRGAPGTLLLALGLEQAFAAGLSRVELGGGDDAYKLRWTREVRERRLVRVFPRGPLGALEWAAFALGRPVARRILRRGSS